MDGGGKIILGEKVKKFTIDNIGLIISMNVKITKNHHMSSDTDREHGEPDVELFDE